MEKAPQHHQALRQQRPLDLDAIEAFVRIAELGSFTRAADAMQTTQAAVSLKLKRLEDRLGCRLIDRTPRHVELSARGAAFLALTVGEFRSLVAMGAGPSRSGFLSAYFALVGAHGLHVTAGLAWMLLLTVRTLRRGIDAGTVARADRLAMFWHLVGIVWIGVYSVVYLPGLAW